MAVGAGVGAAETSATAMAQTDAKAARETMTERTDMVVVMCDACVM